MRFCFVPVFVPEAMGEMRSSPVVDDAVGGWLSAKADGGNEKLKNCAASPNRYGSIAEPPKPPPFPSASALSFILAIATAIFCNSRRTMIKSGVSRIKRLCSPNELDYCI